MKKLIYIVIVLFALFAGFFVGNKTNVGKPVDKRFLEYDKSIYKPFYNGSYVCGVDFEPGAYEVEIKDGADGNGNATIKSIDKETGEEKTESTFVHLNSLGYLFTIQEGETLIFDTSISHEMRVKKAD